MRLICPGCAAQYEVHAAAIPPEGRDVQCSNCGHTWFQRPEGEQPADTEQPTTPETAAPDTPDQDMPENEEPRVARPVFSEMATQQDGPVTAAPPEPASTDKAGSVLPEIAWPDDDPAPARPNPAPRKIDDAVLAVLREEAEREARARRAESGSLETQPDLGLALQQQAAPRRNSLPADPGAGVQPRRPAKSDAAASRPDATEPTSSRGRRLPNIDEINSTLRGTSERKGKDALPPDTVQEAEQNRRSFRTGFLVVVVIATLALLIYALARPIASAVPALAPVLESYAAAMDAARLWLATRTEAVMRRLLDWLS